MVNKISQKKLNFLPTDTKMDSKNNLPQNDISHQLNNLHNELEVYNELFNDSQVPAELSIFQSNMNIQEKQTYEKKMEFLSDEKFFPGRSEKTNSDLIKKFLNDQKNTIQSENIHEEKASKAKEEKGMLERLIIKMNL